MLGGRGAQNQTAFFHCLTVLLRRQSHHIGRNVDAIKFRVALFQALFQNVAVGEPYIQNCCVIFYVFDDEFCHFAVHTTH